MFLCIFGVHLGQCLHRQKVYMTGTMKSNRGPPAFLRGIPLAKRSSQFMRKNAVLLVKFHDRKVLYSVSTG